MTQFRFHIFSFFMLVGILFLTEKTSAQKPILFQIPSSAAQIDAAKSIGDSNLVAQYKRSDNQIKNAIYKDFKTYFTYSPVYFFSTSDYEKVKNGDLENVNFVDNTGQPIMLPNEMPSYYTANISFFPRVYEKVEMNGEVVLQETPENHFGLGIIMRDENFNPLTGNLRFTECKIAKRGPWFNRKKRYYVFMGSDLLNRKMVGGAVSQ